MKRLMNHAHQFLIQIRNLGIPNSHLKKSKMFFNNFAAHSYLSLLCLILISNSVAVAQTSKTHKDEKQSSTEYELLSIKRYGLQNAVGLTAADLILETEEIFDSSDDSEDKGILIRTKSTTRMLFEDSSDRFATYSYARGESNGFSVRNDEDRDKENRKSSFPKFTGFTAIDDEVHLFRDGKKTEPGREEFPSGRVDFLNVIGFADPRGLMVSGHIGPSRNVFEFSDATPNESGEFLYEVSKKTNSLRVKQTYEDSGVPDCTAVATEVFDLDSLMLESRTVVLVKKADNVQVPFQKLKISWIERGSIFVPSTFSMEKNTAKTIDGRRVPGKLTRSGTIHWLSVNSALKEKELFDGSQLESANQIKALLVPEEILK